MRNTLYRIASIFAGTPDATSALYHGSLFICENAIVSIPVDIFVNPSEFPLLFSISSCFDVHISSFSFLKNSMVVLEEVSIFSSFRPFSFVKN